MSISIQKAPIIGATIIVIVVGLFIAVIPQLHSGKLILKTGSSEINIDFPGRELNLNTLLDELAKNPQQWSETRAILRESYGFFEIDQYLADRLRRELGQSAASSELRKLLSQLEGPFQRHYHQFYDITKTDTVRALAALEYEHEVARGIRRLRDRAEGIFEERGIDAEIRLLHPDDIEDGQAIVCTGSEYLGRDLLLLNPDDPNRLTQVHARNTTPCVARPDVAGRDLEIIHLRPTDGEKLYDDLAGREVMHTIVFPVPSGYIVKPYPGANMTVADVN